MAMLSQRPRLLAGLEKNSCSSASFFSKANKISILIRTPEFIKPKRNQGIFREILCTPGMLMPFLEIKEFRTMNENNFNFILFSGRIATKRIGEEEKFRSATTTGSWIYFQVTKSIFLAASLRPRETETK